jgi:hypothetical protein
LFKIKDTKEAYFVFFNFDNEDKSIVFRKNIIKETSVEKMFDEVRRLIDEYTSIVEGVLPENSQEGLACIYMRSPKCL